MGPFVFSKEKTQKMMRNVLFALLPILLFNIYKNGILPFHKGYISFIEIFRPVFFTLCGALTSFLVETLYLMIRKRKDLILKTYSFFPGLFLGFLLPLSTPFYVLILSSIVATISKLISGGFGKNIINPALIGYLFAIFLLGSSLGSYANVYEIDAISSSTPLTNAVMVGKIASYSKLVKPYGNLGYFFLGLIPGGMGEVSSLLCILALVYLTATKTIKWKIPISYISTVFLLTFIIARISNIGIYYPLFHILSGGLLFGAIFMATDPVSSTVTPFGQVLQGILLGILTIIFRFVFTEGVAISIVLVNFLVPLLDKIGACARFNPITWGVWLGLCALFIMLTGIVLSILFKTKPNQDANFAIVEKKKEQNKTVYVVTQKGYGGKIKGEVVVEKDKIITMTILSSHESADRYQLIVDANYIDQILQNQDDLENLDAISTATVTSNALVRMAINVLEDYKN